MSKPTKTSLLAPQIAGMEYHEGVIEDNITITAAHAHRSKCSFVKTPN